MKRKETLELERALEAFAKERGWFGCEEITIGFANNGHGNEICDYILMDSKGIIRCYELKVTLSDLKSKAKKSWYGHYNYLVVSNDLFNKIQNFDEYIPNHVGVIVGHEFKSDSKPPWRLETAFRPKKQDISTEQQLMITQSMIRSMMNKCMKYKDSKSLKIMAERNKENRDLKKRHDELYADNCDMKWMESSIERNIRKTTGIKIQLRDIAEMIIDTKSD